MKKTFLLRSLIAACLICLTSLSAKAKVYLSEDFDYPNVEQLVETSEWLQYSTVTTNPILLSTGSLIKAGYANEVVGKQVTLGTESSSQKAFIGFKDGENALPFVYSADKSIYYSVLINVESAPTSAPAYFICFVQSLSAAFEENKTPTEFARLFATQSAEGKYKLSVSRNNTTLAEASAELLYGETYLAVVKYTFKEGTTNDVVSLYIEPSAIAEPATADAVYNASSGSDVVSSSTTRGIEGIEVRQGQTSTRNAAALTLDAIRVADTWAELFAAAGTGEGGGEGGEETPVPTITLSTDEISFYTQLVFTTDELTDKFTISAKDLTSDITLTSSDAQVTVEPATIKKEDAAAEGGVEVTVTLKSTTMGEYAATISATSEGAQTQTLSVGWYANPSVENIATLRAAYATDPDSYAYGTRINNPVTITHIYTQNDIPMWAVQDESGALFVSDDYGLIAGTYNVGDQVVGLIGMPSVSFGTMTYTIAITPAASIGNQVIEPLVLTLAEWQADAAKYCSYLVRINDVSFAETENALAYGTQYEFTQGELSSKMNLYAGSELIGKTLPAKADIIGIVRNPSGNLISPRSKADIIAKAGETTGVESIVAANVWVADGALHVQGADAMTVEVLNIAGQTILTETFAAGAHAISLDNGMYLVKVNGAVQKVIVR